jgi:hypothetical protein
MLTLLARNVAGVLLFAAIASSQPSKAAQWTDVCREYLSSSSAPYACLYDVDGDGTPELITRSPGSVAVISLKDGEALQAASLDYISTFAAPADSSEKGLYVLAGEVDGSSMKISKLGPDFKLAEVGAIERAFTEMDFNSNKALAEKYILSGKELSKSEFLAQSPYGATVSLRKIQFESKELSSHSIESMISSYPNPGGGPEFLYGVSGGYGTPGTGTFATYPQFRYDVFPFSNLNVSNLPETWLLMIDGAFVPEAGLKAANGEPLVPLKLAEERIPKAKGAKPELIGGTQYVSSSGIAGQGLKADSAHFSNKLNVLSIESGTVDAKYSKDLALKLFQGELESRRIAEEKKGYERIQPDTFDRFKELEISSLPDIGRYYLYEIPGVGISLLFNSLTGEAYSSNDLSGFEPGADAMAGIVDNLSYPQPGTTNLAGVSLSTSSKQLRHSDGFVEPLQDGYVGLVINGSIAKSANVVIENDRTLVPLRLIAESLGAKVEWVPETKGISIQDGERVLSLAIGSASPELDGTEIKIDVAPKIIDGYTYVPLRFIAESLDCNVDWSDGSAGGAGPRYLSGIRHAIVSRYPEHVAPRPKVAAIAQLENDLKDAYELRYSTFEPLSQKPASGSAQDKLRYFITSLDAPEENDRFYIMTLGEDTQLWIDKMTFALVIYENGSSQSFSSFYTGSPESIDKLISLL